MYSKIFALLFLLLYFWYMTSPKIILHATRPTQSILDDPKPIIFRGIKASAKDNSFKFSVNNHILWRDVIPDSYMILQKKFIKQDACHYAVDGSFVPATGEVLYDFVEKDKLNSENFNFEPNASFALNTKNPFYFSCQQGRIHQLHMCPSGQFFQNSTCQLIDKCAGQYDSKTFADPYDNTRYYECLQEQLISKACPPGEYFLYNKCFNSDFMGLFCAAVEKPKILDSQTLVVCIDGNIKYEVCPPGFRYFDTPTCQPDMCTGKPDNQRLPLPDEQVGPLSFSPGYVICLDEKVAYTKKCPQTWDYYLSKGENLTHLPQVFDGSECTIPELCTNVTLTDPEVIVPAHEFTKHLQNWEYSNLFDQTNGYKCEGKTRKRMGAEPGNLIHPKRLKIEPACDNLTEKVVISGSFTDYFDCKTSSVQKCPGNKFFNGHECQSPIPHAFKYGNLDIFRLDSLREDNWMKPWRYSSNKTEETCKDPETELLKGYNVCSHPDCTLYPWLTQINFQVAHKDGSICKYDEPTRTIRKEETDDIYLYWAQRPVPEKDPNEKCTPGQNTQSGNFVFDQTIFATCDDKQPFVFCPSSSTNGIQLVQGSKSSFWACLPPGMKGIFPPNTQHDFQKNEVNVLHPVVNMNSDALINGIGRAITFIGDYNHSKFTLKTLNHPIQATYNYRVTHPIEVVWEYNVPSPPEMEGIITPENTGAYIMKLKGFTTKPVHIFNYGIKDSVPSLTLT